MTDARFGNTLAAKIFLLVMGALMSAGTWAQPTAVVDPLSRTEVTTGDLSPVTFDVSFTDADFANLAATDVGLTPGGTADALVDVTATQFQKAMTFIGAATRLDPVGMSPTFGPFVLDDALTMEAWVRPTTGDPGGVIVNYNGFAGYALGIAQAATPGEFELECAGFDLVGPLSSSPTVLTADRWYHVACTFDPADTGSEVRLYVDGAEVSSGSGNPINFGGGGPINPVGGDDTLRVGTGGSPGNPFGTFPGAIDEVRLWSDARSASEIANNLDTTISPSSAGLLAYWQFDALTDEGEGVAGSNDIADQTGNNLHLDTGALPGGVVTEANALFGATVTLSDFSGNGTLDVDLAAGIAGDNGGNLSAAVLVPETVSVLTTAAAPPQILSITPDNPGPTNSDTTTFTVLFDQVVSGFAANDTRVGLPAGRTLDSVVVTSLSGTDWEVVVTLNADEESDDDLRLTIVAGAVQSDASGLSNTRIRFSPRVRIDNIAPTPTISTPAGSPRNPSPFELTIRFDEDVTGFDASDIPVANATLGPLTGSAASYATTVTPTVTDGTVSLGPLALGAAVDAAGNASSPTGILEIEIDTTAPSFTTEALDIVAGDTFTRQLAFNEAVTGLTLGAFSITGTTGTAAGTLAAVNAVAVSPTCAAGQCYDLLVSNVDGEGELEITLAAGSVADGGGLQNLEQALTQAVDRILPELVSTDAAPTLAGVDQRIAFTVNATESVAFWDPDAIELLTTGNLTVTPLFVIGGSTRLIPVNAASFEIAYTTTGGSGTAQLNVNAGALVDAAGNRSTTSELTPIITVDGTVPDLVSFEPEVSGVQIFPDMVFFEGTLSESVTDFTGVGFSAVASGASNLPGDINPLVSITDPAELIAPDRFRVGVDISALPRGDVFELAINAGTIALTDEAGNFRRIENRQSLAATIDLVPAQPPVLTTVRPATNVSPIAFEANFLEVVTGFEVSNVLVTGGTVSDFAGSVASYTFSVTPDGDGTIAAIIPAGAARNIEGRETQASEQIDVMFDSTPPTVIAVGSDVDGITNVRNFQLLFQVSEPLDRSSLIGALTVNAVTSDFLTAAFSDSGEGQAGLDVINVALTGTSGTFTFTVPAGAVTDLAGNPTTAAFALPAPITFDSDKPAVVDLTTSFVEGDNPIDPLSDSISATSVTVEFDFGEPITGLDINDFRIDRDTGALGFGDTSLELVGDTGGRFSVLDIGGDGVLDISLNADAISDELGNRNDEQLLDRRNINNTPLEVVSITTDSERVFDDLATFTVTWSKPVERLDASRFAFAKDSLVFSQGITTTVTAIDGLRSSVTLEGSAPGEETTFGLGEFTLAIADRAAFDRFDNPNQNVDPIPGPLVARVGPLDANGFLITGADESSFLGDNAFTASGETLIINGIFSLSGGPLSAPVASVEFDGQILTLTGVFSTLGSQGAELFEARLAEIDTETLSLELPRTASASPIDLGGLQDRFRACDIRFGPDRRSLFLAGGVDFTNYFIDRVFLDPSVGPARVFPGALLGLAEPGRCSPSALAFQVRDAEPTANGLALDVRFDAIDLNGDGADEGVLISGRVALNGSDGTLVPLGTFDVEFSGFDWNYDAITFGDGSMFELRVTNLTREQGGFTLSAGDLVIEADLTTILPTELVFTADVAYRVEIPFFDPTFEVRTVEVLTMINPVWGFDLAS